MAANNSLARRTTQTSQGSRTDDIGRTVTAETGSSTVTPGIETTTVIKPEAKSQATQLTYTGTTTGTDLKAPQTTTRTSAPQTTTQTSAPHEVRTVNEASTNLSTSAEDAVMEIEFTLKVRDLTGC